MPVVAGTPYAARADLANLGLIGGVLTNISTTTQDAALLAASSMADSYLQSRYDLPLTSWGQDLVRIVCVVAAYDLMTSKGYNPAAGADQNVRQRYLDALAWLDEVGKGTQTPAYVLDASAGGNTGATGSTSSTDDSTITTSAGGLQMVTQNVRGWTDRGGTRSAWDGGWAK